MDGEDCAVEVTGGMSDGVRCGLVCTSRNTAEVLGQVPQPTLSAGYAAKFDGTHLLVHR